MSLFDRPKNTISPLVRGLTDIHPGERPLVLYTFGPAGNPWDAARISAYFRDEFSEDMEGRGNDFAFHQCRSRVLPPAILNMDRSKGQFNYYSDGEQQEVFFGFNSSLFSTADTVWAADDNFILARMGYDLFIDPLGLFAGYTDPLE